MPVTRKTLHIDTSKGPFFRGIGDSIVLAWVVEGAKGSEMELSVHANSTKRDVLEMLGVPMHPEPIGVGLSDVPVFDMEDSGGKPRTDRIAQILGLSTKAKRPTVSIPCWAKHKAGQFWGERNGKTRILLCPEVKDISREWLYWPVLKAVLDDCGHQVEMLVPDREIHYGYATAILSLADLVIAVDSSHAHMAATLGVKTLVLLGPTRENVFAHADNVQCLSTPTDIQECSGCCFNYKLFSRTCRKNGCAALQLIGVSSVLQALQELITDDL